MRILINGVDIEFTLDKEQTLSDVVGSLNEFIVTNNHLIDRLDVNGYEMELDKALKNGMSLQDVDAIHITTKNLIEEVQNTFVSMRDYYKFIKSLSDDMSHLYHKLSTIYPEILNYKLATETVFSVLRIPSDIVFANEHYLPRLLDDFKNKLEILESYWHNEEQATEILTQIIDLMGIINIQIIPQAVLLYNVLYTEQGDRAKMTLQLLDTYEEYLPYLSRIGEFLTSGQDREAMQYVQEGIHFYWALYRIRKGMMGGDDHSLNDKEKAISGAIESIAGALEDQDMISVSDTVEYELKEMLKDYILAIRKTLK